MMRVCVAVAALAVALAWGSDCDYKNDRFRIENLGASGKFRVYQLNDKGEDEGGNLKISMSKMEEKTASGGNVNNKISGWASKDFTWECKECAYTTRNDATGAVEEKSDACSTFVLTEAVDGTDVQIRVTTWLYDDDTTFVIECPEPVTPSPVTPAPVTPAPVPAPERRRLLNATTECEDQVVTIEGEGLKFTVEIAHWPFAAPENKLHFGITVQAAGGPDDEGAGSTDDADATTAVPQGRRLLEKDTVQLGDFEIESPDSAVVDHGDGTGSNIAVKVDATVSGSKVDIDYVFDSFDGAMTYDPFVAGRTEAGGDPADDDGDAAARQAVAVAFGAAVAAVAALQ